MRSKVVKGRRKEIQKSVYIPKADYTVSNDRGATFWISLSDFTKYFYILTICFAQKDYKQSFMQDQVFSYKWGAFEFDLP